MVIGVDICLVVGAERMGAMRTFVQRGVDGGIGVLGERACHAWAPGARLLAAGPGRFGFYPFEGGRLELSGVLAGAASRASSAAMRAIKALIC